METPEPARWLPYDRSMETRYGAPIQGSDKAMLSAMLDHYRALILEICSGLTEEQLRRPMVPSGTSLLAIVKHLAFTERGWFQEHVANEPYKWPFDPETDPDGDWRLEDDDTSENVFQMYRDACERSREIIAEADLDYVSELPRRRLDYSVRWIMIHMLEETARHAGHADILREMIDNKTGWGYDP